jgi:hypothetical protein
MQGDELTFSRQAEILFDLVHLPQYVLSSVSTMQAVCRFCRTVGGTSSLSLQVSRIQKFLARTNQKPSQYSKFASQAQGSQQTMIGSRDGMTLIYLLRLL